MAEQITESPTFEETDTEIKAAETHDVIDTDVDGLIAELEKAGISTPDQLANKLAVTREYGDMANKLGEIRQENRELREMLEADRARNREEDFGNGRETDLETMMLKVIRKDREEQQKLAFQNQQINIQRYQKITTHKHYGKVKEVFEEKLKDPNTMIQLQTGQITHEDLYYDTLNEYWEGIARKSLKTIKTLKGEGPTGEEVPHVETETPIPGKTPTEDEEGREVINGYRERVNKGQSLTEEEEIDALIRVLRGP